MNRTGVGRGIDGVVSKITANHLFKSALVILGVAFTASTVMNNYYSIRVHKMNIKEQEEKDKSRKS